MKYNIYYQKNNRIKVLKLDSQNIKSIQLNKNYPLNIIYIEESKRLEFNIFNNENEKLEMFYEIKTMLEANLELKYIVDILLKSDFNSKNRRVLELIQISIKNGQNIYESLEEEKNYLGELIIFFKIAHDNSNMKESMQSLYLMLEKENSIKNNISKLLTYPVVLIISIFTTIFVLFIYVVPKFENIYAQFGSNLPLSTQILLKVKDILFNHYFLVAAMIIVFFISLKIIYSIYKYYIDKFILTNIPIFSTLYKNILLYKLFLSLSLQVNSKEKFYNALLNSINTVNNIYLKSKLQYILKDIKNGKSIYYAFLQTNSFDLFTLRLLHTAEVTNRLGELLENIVHIYDSNIVKNIEKFKVYFEPLLIFIISSVVLWLVLAIMTPIWDLGSVIK